ncbi:MAG: PQQ-binding-like beta-propeller repeat protein [Vicinamibacterales bacterium]
MRRDAPRRLLLAASLAVAAGVLTLGPTAAVLLAQALPGAPRNLRLQLGAGPLGGWPMAGANPQRTSNSVADVSTVRSVAWYRPIEAFISGTTQLVTAEGRVYVATARGLIVLEAENGDLVCRFDTELPVSTPTVSDGTVYVPGFDRTLYALDSATCGIRWSFTGAFAGFSANPIVVDGRVYIGNRDGRFYALNASNGSLAWAFDTGGPIMQSAAYDSGVLYFASMDMYGYALNASNGSLVWRTPQKLPGEQYTTWWPVIHQSYVVWAGATAYKYDSSPGARDAGQYGVDFDAFFGVPTTTLNAGTVISSSDGSHGWAAGSTVMSTTASVGSYTLQGWADGFPARRVYAVVNKSNGVEPFYLPMLEAGQNNQAQMHPPVSDGEALYFNGPYQKAGANIPRSRVFAWREGTAWLRAVGATTFAIDEPLALSMASGRVLANLCCDREARSLAPTSISYWNYSERLDAVLPSQGAAGSYDPTWAFYNGPQLLERLQGYYKGASASRNGVYHNHGMQNPLVPLAFINAASQRVERIFTHRSNAIIALGPAAAEAYQPMVTINPNPPNRARTMGATELRARVEREVQRMVDLFVAQGENGFLRPAYISDGGGLSNNIIQPEPNTYFRVPADTLYTLSVAYPHLSTGLQSQVRSYLAAYWQRYFASQQVRGVGWSTGTQREAMVYPPEVAARMAEIGDTLGGTMPQRVFYAAWRYAQVVPAQAATIYQALRPLLVYPPPALDIVMGPGVYNDYIAGYQGFLNLYDMAGTNPDPSLRANVANQLGSLLNTRITGFAKDHPWRGTVDNPGGLSVNNYARRFNCSRNFLYMTPSLGQAMRSSAQASTIQAALSEYEYVCPAWFIARDSNSFQEASAHHIFDSHALFLAKAYVAAQSQPELSKWLDVPWMLGDLYYVQNVVAALEAGGGS